MREHQILACPHCTGQILNDPNLAGQVLSCPHCQREFQMPALATDDQPAETESIRFNCPHCGTALRARPEYEGKIKKCRACGQMVQVTRGLDADVVLVQQPIPNESKLCPFCAEEIKKIAVKCKHCGESLNHSANPSPQPQDKQPALFFAGRGRFNFTGSYDQAFELTRQAMRESGVKISQASKERAIIAGSCSYGINFFGISVTATFYAAGSETGIEITASLSDAFDTMGVCDKKVDEIGSRLCALVAAASSPGSTPGDKGAATFDFAAGEIVSTGAPPYRHREGPSHHGKAVTGFIFCLLGLCFPPAAILGLILCGLASTGIATSRNKAGQMWASIGAVIGLCVIVIWCLMLLSHFR